MSSAQIQPNPFMYPLPPCLSTVVTLSLSLDVGVPTICSSHEYHGFLISVRSKTLNKQRRTIDSRAQNLSMSSPAIIAFVHRTSLAIF